MLPLRDEMPTTRFPLATILIIAANVAVFAYELMVSGSGGQGALQQAVVNFGVVPARVSAHPLSESTLVTFVASMFMHAGWLHIGGNMLYLWIFGNNVEDVMGRAWFTLFYFAAGFAASAAQVLASPQSSVPGIGASGAIAGVLAAYLLFFPRAKVDTLIFLGIFARIARIPAVVVLGFWFLLQVVSGAGSLGTDAASGGVAYFAHIGGFVTGLLLCLPWLPRARRLAGRYA
jgi:membrane associated rhomboid family serine protease